MILSITLKNLQVAFSWSDFRPVYNVLHKIRDTWPNIPIMTLTATCPIYVEKIIHAKLQLQAPLSLRTTLNRPNLHFECHPKRHGIYDFLPYLRDHNEGSAIVYVITKADAEDYAEDLNARGIICKPYHSEAKERSRTLNEFRTGMLKTVVCTIAFGMGIDRPDVRQVIHYGMPRTIESYYQEGKFLHFNLS